MLRRPTVAGLALLAVATATVVWSGLLLPPPLWILKYGPTPGCEPTGRTWTIEGVEFVEIGRGISRMGSDWLLDRETFPAYGFRRGDLPGRLAGRLGLPWGTHARPSWEMPVHWVEFPHGFAVATTEVTNAQYRRFLEERPENEHPPEWVRHGFGGDGQAVVGVGAAAARAYCEWLAEKSGLRVRLPSEAEWECACRGGSRGEYGFAGDESRLGEYAWLVGNAEGRTHEVAAREANSWGLYDMHGNAWEFCADLHHWCYTELPEKKSWVTGYAPVDGSAWMDLAGSSGPVVRGGCALDEPVLLRSSFRMDEGSVTMHHFRTPVGFRPAFTPPDR